MFYCVLFVLACILSVSHWSCSIFRYPHRTTYTEPLIHSHTLIQSLLSQISSYYILFTMYICHRSWFTRAFALLDHWSFQQLVILVLVWLFPDHTASLDVWPSKPLVHSTCTFPLIHAPDLAVVLVTSEGLFLQMRPNSSLELCYTLRTLPFQHSFLSQTTLSFSFV